MQVAIEDFRTALTPEQRGQFQAYQTSPSLDAVIRLASEVDAEQAQHGAHCVGTRLHSFLESICDFSSVVDTFVSSNPATAALVWGSVKFAILVTIPLVVLY